MFPPSNPVEAARQYARDATALVTGATTPTPQPAALRAKSPYDLGWDGRYDHFLYTDEFIHNPPVMPVFTTTHQGEAA